MSYGPARCSCRAVLGWLGVDCGYWLLVIGYSLLISYVVCVCICICVVVSMGVVGRSVEAYSWWNIIG